MLLSKLNKTYLNRLFEKYYKENILPIFKLQLLFDWNEYYYFCLWKVICKLSGPGQTNERLIWGWHPVLTPDSQEQYEVQVWDPALLPKPQLPCPPHVMQWKVWFAKITAQQQIFSWVVHLGKFQQQWSQADVQRLFSACVSTSESCAEEAGGWAFTTCSHLCVRELISHRSVHYWFRTSWHQTVCTHGCREGGGERGWRPVLPWAWADSIRPRAGAVRPWNLTTSPPPPHLISP